tara:strand:- start:406 stop:1458 length:1053 start_codon:yes stop_codon:yes gene_type:complete
MKVLIAGGAGFIGSHTCLALLQKGYDLIVVDSYINSNKKSLEKVIDILKLNTRIENVDIKIINADIRDNEVLEGIFLDNEKSDNPIEAVIHFAGLKSVRESVLNPLLYWNANVNSAINLFTVMNKFNCRTIVFSSSANVYGLKKNTLISEQCDLNPINPYGRTKVAIEHLLNDLYNSNPEKWRIANLRYFNPIGAHSSGMIGESPIGIPNNIFPYITQVASGKLKELNIYGNDWPTSDGTGVRDYIHVMDLAEGHISALDYLINSNNQIINLNLGTGIGTSVLELVNTFESVNNLTIPLRFTSRRKGDSCKVIADNSLAISCLNWYPRRDIRQMCIDGWKWQSSNPNGYI